MAKVKPLEIPLTSVSSEFTFDRFEVMLTSHTIICNGGVGVNNGDVIVYGRIGNGQRQIITTFDMKSDFKIAYFRGSYNQIEFEPESLNGDGQYAIYMISTD